MTRSDLSSLRVLHVVTMVSPDGAFGGPVRVATHQAAALRDRGHRVTILAGAHGYEPGSVPKDLDGTPAQLFPLHRVVPAGGVSGLASAALLRWVWRTLPGVDLVHVHLARDLVTLPVARLAALRGIPVVLQPHGMVVPSGSALAPALDALLTRRVLGDAATVLHLTPQERAGLLVVARRPPALQPLGNGVPAAAEPPAPPARPEVLFCGRLQERKRPVLFVEAARRLLAEGTDASFVLVGPDAGQGPAVAAAVAAVGDRQRLRWEGALAPDDVLARIARASAVALPSVDEPYPMSVLEAMSVGRAVLVTDSCGLADAVRRHDCGVVVDASLDGLVDGLRALVADAQTLRRQGRHALAAARSTFGMAAVADRLEEVYAAALQ